MNKTSDAGDGRAYFTSIPNVVCALGLSPFELALYVHLKRTAGEDGACWKSNKTLAKETGMSTGMIIKAREGLKQPRPELKGRSLISDHEDTNSPGRPRHVITINDIWVDNVNALAANQRLHHDQQKSSRDLQKSPHDFQKSYHDIQKSPHDIKKNPIEEEPLEEGKKSKKQTSSPARKLAATGDVELPDWLPAEVLQQWLDYKREMKHPVTQTALPALIRKLEKYNARGQPPAEVIEQSMANGWQGLFELSEGNGNGTNQPNANAPRQQYGRAEVTRDYSKFDRAAGRSDGGPAGQHH